MSNPNLAAVTSLTADILVSAQLASGNNDFVVGASESWTVKSVTLCNTGTGNATLNVSVIKSAGTARKVLHNESIAPGATFTDGTVLATMLPASATLRINSDVGSAVDVTITGLVAT